MSTNRAALATAAALLVTATLAVTGAGTAQARAAAPVTYEIVIEGTASGNAFQRTGTITLMPTTSEVTTNDVNPYEVCLRSGFPAGTPEVGAIWYGTNTSCFPDNGQAVDLTYAVEDETGYYTEPDPNVQALMVNHWTASENYIYAFPYGPYQGATSYRFADDGTVTGTVELVGHGGMGGNSTYSAALSGTRVQ
jgi:hypothetical protein